MAARTTSNYPVAPSSTFPASGFSRESFAHGGVTVDDLGCWQGMTGVKAAPFEILEISDCPTKVFAV
jgi:hypothetical protein